MNLSGSPRGPADRSSTPSDRGVALITVRQRQGNLALLAAPRCQNSKYTGNVVVFVISLGPPVLIDEVEALTIPGCFAPSTDTANRI